MKHSLFLFFLLLPFFGSTQDYFSRILPTEDNPLVKTITKFNTEYIISTDFFSTDGVKGGLLIVSEDGLDVDRRKFDNTDLGLSPLVIYNDDIYLAGENPATEGDSTLILAKINTNDYDLEWVEEYSLPVKTTVNSALNSLGDHFYLLNVNNPGIDPQYKRELVVVKVKPNGEEVAKYYYNRDKETTYALAMLNTYDSNLILSNVFSKYNENIGTYSQLIKINAEGEEIWKYESEETLNNGAVPTWATELSDSTILQTYYVNRFWDWDFINNFWNRNPNKFIWVNKEGELIKEKYIITKAADDLHYQGVKRGLGDYFFAYGYIDQLDDDPGLKYSCHLTKFSNQGDTIWTHQYQHPEYSANRDRNNIRDILEEENGDITVLADLSHPDSKQEVWLFKLNSDGCYVNSDCEDMRNLTSINDGEKVNFSIYPNPASEIINISAKNIIKSVNLVNTNGKLLISINPNINQISLDLSALISGIYSIQLTDQFNNVKSHQVVIE